MGGHEEKKSHEFSDMSCTSSVDYSVVRQRPGTTCAHAEVVLPLLPLHLCSSLLLATEAGPLICRPSAPHLLLQRLLLPDRGLIELHFRLIC
jgi:hypothetical protein